MKVIPLSKPRRLWNHIKSYASRLFNKTTKVTITGRSHGFKGSSDQVTIEIVQPHSSKSRDAAVKAYVNTPARPLLGRHQWWQ